MGINWTSSNAEQLLWSLTAQTRSDSWGSAVCCQWLHWSRQLHQGTPAGPQVALPHILLSKTIKPMEILYLFLWLIFSSFLNGWNFSFDRTVLLNGLSSFKPWCLFQLGAKLPFWASHNPRKLFGMGIIPKFSEQSGKRGIGRRW